VRRFKLTARFIIWLEYFLDGKGADYGFQSMDGIFRTRRSGKEEILRKYGVQLE